MPTPPTADIIAHTKKWLSSVVIAHTLCPFAKREYDRGRIHFAVIEAADMPSQLEHIIMECAALDADEGRETSLLIFPGALDDFDAYLDFLEIANALLNKQGYEGIYQLASFHPRYRFAEAGLDDAGEDAANYTNRSPYPIVHILREASVAAALATFPNPETIPQRNIDLTRGLGLSAMKALLAACYE